MTSVGEVSLSNETIYSLRRDDNFETYYLIWLDAAINSEENINAQERFRVSINYLQTFEKLDECEKYIRSVSSQDRIVLVVSGQFGQHLVPDIHQLQQVFSIYVYCGNKEFHEQWSQKYHKVKGVHNQLDALITQMQFDHSGRRQNKPDEPLSISVFNSNNNDEQSTTGLDGQFVQSQLLISCLLKMETSLADRNEFISHCRHIYEGNNSQLKFIDEFEQEYDSEYSLWWYTKEGFLYKLLNKALRIQNIDLLFLYRFFIRDIENQLHRRQHRERIRVYRGQLLSMAELNVLRNSKETLISINSFFSTTWNIEMALLYLGQNSNDNELERVLFEVEADPNQKGVKPFADLSKISYFPEDEVLIMAGSTFCVKNIYSDKNQIWHIEMSLCSDIDHGLQTTFHHMRNQYSSNKTELLLLANVLIDMAQFDHAEKYLLRLLKQLPSHHEDIYKCYHALGKISFEKGNYDLGLNYLQKAVSILPNFESNDSRLAYVYNSIGEIYQTIGDFTKALEIYEKALIIFKNTFGDKHESIAWCYNNLGTVYVEQNNYSQAFKYLMKALDIKTILLPPKHPCLSNTYNNLGNVHYYLQQYDQALEKYQLSYEIFKKSLAPRHPSLARILKNIGIVHEVQGNYIQARENYKKAGSIREKVLSSTHPDLVEIKIDIARVSLKT